MSDHAHITPEPRYPLIHHVYPTAGHEHVTNGKACWCGPDTYRLCTQCDGDSACWACEGDGVILIEGVPLPGDPLLIVHHYIVDTATFTLMDRPSSRPTNLRRRPRWRRRKPRR